MSARASRGLWLGVTVGVCVSTLGCGSEPPSGRMPNGGGMAGIGSAAGTFAGRAGGSGLSAGTGGFAGSSFIQPIAGSGTAAISGEVPSECASALVQTTKNLPTIVFVIDGSGSMCAPFGGATRWQALRTALVDPAKGLIFRLQESVSFGATLYDGTIDFLLALSQPGGGAQNPMCALNYATMKATGVCPQLVEVLPAKLNNAMAISAAYPAIELGGSTPTDKAMKHVMDTLIAGIVPPGPDQKPQSPIYVILATDGAPNDICVMGTGGDGSAQRQGVITAVDQGAAAGIVTWVISLAGDDPALQTHLDEVAKHGEPKNAMARTFNPDNPDALIMTLAQLLGGAVGCHIELNGKVAVGQECMGQVKHNGAGLPCCQQVAGAWKCNEQPAPTPNGWHLSDEHSIELIGDACTKFLIGPDELLAATFPCEVFRPL